MAAKYRILLNMMRSANDRLDPSNVIGTIMDNVRKLIPCEAWSILLLSEDREELIFERTRGVAAGNLAFARLKVGEGIAGWVAQNRRPAIVNDVRNDGRFNSTFDQATQFQTRSILCAPLLSRDLVIGVVELINRSSRNQRFTRQDLSLLSTLLNIVSVSLHNALLFQETEKLAITDDLTKLYNNRYINQSLQKMVDDHRIRRKSLTVIFLDLDGFKQVNDQFGHVVGGRTLVEVGRVILNVVEKGSIVARYGGDEFMIVLPETKEEQALQTAERIRSSLQGHDFQGVTPKPIRLSASFGISAFPRNAQDMTELIQKADRAMYAVKFAGKNAVRLADAD